MHNTDALLLKLNRLQMTLRTIEDSLVVFEQREDRKDWIPCFANYRLQLVDEIAALEAELLRLENLDGQAVS